MAKSPEEMLASMIHNLPEKTGKTLDQWLQLIRQSNLSKHGELVKHLKSEYNLTHGYANLIAHKHLKSDSDSAADQADLVAAQYAGDKSGLRPLYDRIVGIVQKFGDDVVISPKKNYVSLRRSKQFALIQPSTKSRIDVGINLPGNTATGKLEESGSFNTMVSHRVRIADKNDLDSELEQWLRAAYEAS
jgi:hypothetical protein